MVDDKPVSRRNTRQQMAIREIFEKAKRPLSAREVAAKANGGPNSIGTATVYRAINRLLDDGWIVPVEIPNEPSRYEVAGLRHHHHFYCRTCRKVYDVEGCPSNMAALTPQGFELEAHEIILYGRCAQCAG